MASDGVFRYLYDNEGNRTRRFVDGNANGLLDAGDTQITEYAWDHRDRLTQVTSRAVYGGAATRLVAYTYDVFDHVIARNHDADGAGPQGMQPTFYAYDGDQIILEFNGVQSSNLTHRYLWGPAVDQLLADEQVSSLNTPGNVIWPLADNLGTTRDLAQYDPGTDMTTIANHRVYDAYGNLKSETNAAVDEVFGYTGRMFDESTGLQNNWARWYDPKVGTWLSEDPISYSAGDANLYRYVHNNPVLYVDPSGLQSVAGYPAALAAEVSAAAAAQQAAAGRVTAAAQQLQQALCNPRNAQAIQAAQQRLSAATSQLARATQAVQDKVRAFTDYATTWSQTGQTINPTVTANVNRLAAQSTTTLSQVSSVANNLASIAQRISAPVQRFNSWDAFLRTMGSAGTNNAWHHIVERRLETQFGARAIHCTQNCVPVARNVNQAIANYYSTAPRFTGGLTVRKWLETQTFQEQFEFGMDILYRVLSGQPLPH